MERHGRDLESKADHHQCHARIQEEVALSSPACHFGRHERQVRASRGPEKKSDPVQEKPARESAHEEVLEGALGRSRISSIESRQDIHGQGHQLDRDEHDDEVAGTRQEHHPDGCHQHQEVELPDVHSLPAQVVEGEQKGEDRGSENHEIGRDPECVHGDHAATQRRLEFQQVPVGQESEQHAGNGCPTDPGAARPRAVATLEHVEGQDEETRQGEDHFGQKRPQVVDRRAEVQDHLSIPSVYSSSPRIGMRSKRASDTPITAGAETARVSIWSISASTDAAVRERNGCG